MEMKFYFICLAMFYCFLGKSQSDFGARQHLLRANITISPGLMLEKKISTYYLQGDLGYYLNNKISFEGDFFYYLGGSKSDITFKKNHSLMAGAAYHFGKTNFDPYFGFQPGINLSVVEATSLQGIIRSKVDISPLVSISCGTHFFFHKYFNFQISLAYINGKLFSSISKNPISLNEFRLSAGLGFNIFPKRTSED